MPAYGPPRMRRRPLGETVMLPERGNQVALVPVDLPPEIARQLRPELVPAAEDTTGGRTNYQDPPNAGEWREEKYFAFSGPVSTTLPPITVLTLARAWPMVGFGVNPGDYAGGVGESFQALLFALVKGQRVLIDAFAVSANTGVAQGNVLQMGCAAELVLAITTTSPVNNIQCSLWGATFT